MAAVWLFVRPSIASILKDRNHEEKEEDEENQEAEEDQDIEDKLKERAKSNSARLDEEESPLDSEENLEAEKVPE